MANVRSLELSSEHRAGPPRSRLQREPGGDKARADLAHASVRVTRNAARPMHLNQARNAGGKTLVTLRSVFPTAAIRDRTVKESGAIEGGKQTLARLAQYLANKT